MRRPLRPHDPPASLAGWDSRGEFTAFGAGPRPGAREGSTRNHLAIALVSFAILLLQIAFTRVLSVVLWYHFAFLSVSVALLGLGAPGVWFALRPPGGRALRISLIAAGITVPLSIVGIVLGGEALPGVGGVIRGPGDLTQLRVLLAVVCIVPPYLALGSAVVLLLLRARGPGFARMYAADLLGAATGAALAAPLLDRVPAPTLVAACGLLPLAAALLLDRPLSRLALALSGALIVLLAWGEPLHLRYNKNYPEHNRVLEKWTAMARITVFPKIFWKRDPAQAFGWGMGSRFDPYPIPQLWIEQDGSAGTPITRFDRPPARMHHLFADVTSAGYRMRSPRSVCILGSGGGKDILTALRAGAETVDAVELNPAIVEAVSGPFREYSGDVYRLPGVRSHVREGRSFLTDTDRRWDLIQLSLADSWAATAAGAYAFGENNLYTVEAMRLYLRRVSPGGLVSVSRWFQAPAQFEAPRLVLLARRALELEGVAEPGRHLAVVTAGTVATVLVSSTPMDPGDLARLDDACTEYGFVRHWPTHPGTPGDSYAARVLAGGAAALDIPGVDLTPPTDDRPFFFQMLPVWGRIDSETAARLSLNDSTVVLLRWLTGFVAALAAVVFFLPFAGIRRVSGGAGFRRGSVYFSAIGAAFLLVETALIQRFILYLGHPSHATTVVLACILAGAGAGSFVAARTSPGRVDRWRWLLPALVGAVTLGSPAVFTATLGWAFPVRTAISLALLVPPAFLMGFALPCGMDRFGEERKAWYWALNGFFGVLAGVASLALAMTFGFTAVLWLGTAAYAAAAVLLERTVTS